MALVTEFKLRLRGINSFTSKIVKLSMWSMTLTLSCTMSVSLQFERNPVLFKGFKIALEKKGLDRKTNHHDFLKIETEEIFVLNKATVGGLKLEQSAKEVARPRSTKPPHQRETSSELVSQVRSQKSSCKSLASSCLEDKAASQEGVKKCHLCLSTPSNCLWEALEMKAWSPDKFMKVTSVKVSDDGLLLNSMMIKAKNTTMKERIIDRIVDVTVAMQRQVPTIWTVQQTVENRQVHFLDRVVDMPIVMQQKRSPARLCFSLASRQWRSVTQRACDCS